MLTFGHGTASEIELASLIRANTIEAVVDIRSVAKSRAHPHVRAAEMARWVPDLSGASYEWQPELGYADYMQAPEFLQALDALLKRGVNVAHLMHSGGRQPHVLTEGIRVLPSGLLQYDL
jgi:Protein of unknown function, DUF488